APDQARLDAHTDVGQARALQHDRVLDLAAADHDAVADRREGPDVRLLDPGPAADDRGATDRAVDDLGPRLGDPLAPHLGALGDALDARLQRVEDDAVGFQHVLELAGVLPPALDDVRPDGAALVDQPLDRVGDLELAPRGRPDRLHGIEHRRREHV